MTANLVAFKVTVDANGRDSKPATPIPAPANAAVTGYAAVATDVATLVSDGASPTQAHVTTLAADWVILKAILDGNQTGAAGAVVATVDLASVTDWGKLEAAFRYIKKAAIGAGYLNP